MGRREVGEAHAVGVGFPGLSLYHASKWAVEGFYEALAPELAPFGIHTTLVEPGMIPTGFYGAVDRAPELPAYDGTPAADLLRGGGVPEADMPGDPRKAAEAMIRIAVRITELDDLPRRQLLGSDAYAMVRDALTERLRAVEAQREVALTSDRDDYRPAAR